MSEVKWIKLAVDIFDNRKIRQIEKMPDGDAIIVIWLKLLILAGNVNDGGLVYFTKEIPYTDQLLATQFDRPLATVQFALKTFETFGMIEIVDQLIYISNWEKYQNVDGLEKIREQNRIRQKRWYDKQKLLEPNVRPNVNLTLPNATDIDIEEEKESDIDYIAVVAKWNEIGLNTIRDIKGQRRTLLRARVKDYGIDAVFEALENIKNSDFLRGQGKNGWTATFDWFVKPSNFQKVLEGNYTNKTKKGKVDLSDVKSMLKPAKDINTLLDEMDRL